MPGISTKTAVLITTVILALLITGAGAGLWIYFTSPVLENGEDKTIVIREGMHLKEISGVLEREGLVKNSTAFVLLAKVNDYSRMIKAGEYILNPSMTPGRILEMMTRGEVVSHTVTIPEGFSIEQIAHVLSVSGLIDRVRDIAAEVGLDPHTINLSLGIHGGTEHLPPAEIRQFTTMCGHAMVSPKLVEDVIRQVKTGKIDSWEGSWVLAKPCACGIYNPHRSQELLEELSPLYAVTRW